MISEGVLLMPLWAKASPHSGRASKKPAPMIVESFRRYEYLFMICNVSYKL
jgi:hypothetical protein